MSKEEKMAETGQNKPKNKKKCAIGIIILIFLICGGFSLNHLNNLGKYTEKVCFQSFPGYCEYEMLEHKDNGVIKHRPFIPGLMMFQDHENYSDRRLPQFNFDAYVDADLTVRHCRGLTWVNVPCNETHLIETVLKADNSSVHWWEKHVIPAEKYPINKE